MDWSKYPSFSESEMACKHTGLCKMDPDFMAVLQAIRNEFGPMRVSSGYRHTSHPIEAKKQAPGEHTLGRCADIAVEGKQAFRLIQIALKHGITRIGVQQKGAGRFIHIGIGGPGFPSPAIWSY
jgi:zinc D-Ala-D-Ala carboxypeptidase